MGDQELSFGHVKFEMSERLSSGDVKETVIYTGLEFRGDTWTGRSFSIYIYKITTLNRITKDGSVGESGEYDVWMSREE